MLLLPTKLIYKLYFSKKIPNWYRKFVGDIQIPNEIFDSLRDEIYKNRLNKQQIKDFLIKIQKENAYKNKKIWDNYMEEILPKKHADLDLIIARKSDLTAVIVETRKHPHFKVVVKNVMLHLQHLNACLHIYHGTDNGDYIKEALKEYKNINFINLDVKNLDIEAYNKIMLSKEFWKGIESDKILVFQTDAITFKPLNKKFLEYDYIGAPWKRHICKKNKVAVGNGGLSLRSKQMMLSIIKQNIPRKKNTPEDVYLCQIIKKQNYNLAPFDKALEFATENIFNNQAFGCHKIWEETTSEQLMKILK